MDNKGSKSQLKFVHFGSSLAFDANKQMQSCGGQAHFVAPEILSESDYGIEKCAAWSGGVLLYFLLVGSTPFSGRNNE